MKGTSKDKNTNEKAASFLSKIRQQASTTNIQKENRPNNTHELDSAEMFEASILFNQPVAPRKAEEPLQQVEGPALKSILRSEKMMVEQPEKKGKSVSFYNEGQPIYLMPTDKKWTDEVPNQKKGKFDPEEERALTDAVGQFMATNEIKFAEFEAMISGESSSAVLRKEKLFKLLAGVLPNRSPESCYKYVKRNFHMMRRKGKWTPAELDQLLSLVEKFGRRWKLIGKEMNRTSDDVYDKYRAIGEEGYEQRVRKIWKIRELVVLLSELQSHTNIEFLDRKVKDVLKQEEQHDQEELKQLEKHKYNSKSFVFHNFEALRPYLDVKQLKGIELDKVKWKRITPLVPTKTVFDCRNKIVQLLQVLFRSQKGLDEVLVLFLEKQRATDEYHLDWAKWKHAQFSPNEAKNRFMILKKLIEGRSKKDLPTIVLQMRRRVDCSKQAEQKQSKGA